MQIAMISANYPPTVCGIGDYTFYLSSELQKKGIKIINIHQKSNLIKKWDTLEIIKLIRYLKELDVDLLHLQYEPFGFGKNYLLPILLSQINTPLVLTAHEVFHRHQLEIFRDSFLYKKSHNIIINDQASLRALERINSNFSKKSKILGVGSNILKLDNSYKVKNGPLKKIVHFGKINRNRKIELLIKSINNLRENIFLTIIGPFYPKTDSYHRYLEKLVLSYNLKERIIFTGELENSKVSQLIVDHDLAILPFIDGASPRHGTLQACADLGMPIITTKPVVEEPGLVHLNNVYFCEQNEQSITSAIKELLNNKNLLETLSLNTKKYAEQFSWDKLADKHLEIYKSVNKL